MAKDNPTGRLIEGEIQAEDKLLDKQLRPRSLKEYIGQEQVKDNLKIFLTAAKQRGEEPA